MPSIKTHVKEGPQTPSGSLINGLPIMEILKVPAASSITCNDTLLGALLASASDAQKVCPNQSTREHALPAPLVAHRSSLLWPRQQDAALLHKAFLRNESRQSGGGPHMPMLTHSAACAHVSDAPRWHKTMEARHSWRRSRMRNGRSSLPSRTS